VLVGPLLAAPGALIIQVIANGQVSSWSAVVAIAVLVGTMTCWMEWRSLLTLWRES
jgi:uncharacterized membrane protein YcaP (DUF421 family)